MIKLLEYYSALIPLVPVIGDFAMAPGQADVADFDNDIQILFKSKRKLDRACGICIQNTLTYFNINLRQCQTVWTVCICYPIEVHLALCFRRKPSLCEASGFL